MEWRPPARARAPRESGLGPRRGVCEEPPPQVLPEFQPLQGCQRGNTGQGSELWGGRTTHQPNRSSKEKSAWLLLQFEGPSQSHSIRQLTPHQTDLCCPEIQPLGSTLAAQGGRFQDGAHALSADPLPRSRVYVYPDLLISSFQGPAAPLSPRCYASLSTETFGDECVDQMVQPFATTGGSSSLTPRASVRSLPVAAKVGEC